MNNYNAMNRESKKQQLRQRIVTSETSPKNRKPEKRRDEDSEEIVRRAHNKVRRRRLIIFFVILAILAGGGYAGYRYLKYNQFTSYEDVWSVPLNDGSFVNYIDFGNNFLKYTKDGVSYVDSQGKNIWVKSYEMKTPIAAVNGDFAAIADQQGNKIYICDKNGFQGEATTTLPILRVTVSAKGVAGVIMEDASATYVNLFQKDGTKLDIVVKSTLAKDGYLMDISLSPDGTQLMCSYMYLLHGALQCKVVFYNFSEIGKSAVNRLVGGFDEDYFKDSMVSKVQFLDETWSCAFANNSLTFFSSKNLASPVVVKQEQVEEEINSICYSPRYVGLVVRNTEGANEYRMDVYRANGDKVSSFEFDYPYIHADIDGDNVLLYNEDSCEVYHVSGKKRFAGTFGETITKVTNGRFPNTLIVTGPNSMREIKLK